MRQYLSAEPDSLEYRSMPQGYQRIDEILSRQPMFRGLNEGERAQIVPGCRELRVRKGDVLFSKGDEAEGMHVVVMGQIKLSLPTAQGAEKVVHMCGPGNTFGEAVLFLDKPYPVNAQATTESMVLLIGKHALLNALDGSKVLSRKMLACLSAHLHELLGDMETCMLRGSVQRVVCYLIQSAHRKATTPVSASPCRPASRPSPRASTWRRKPSRGC